MTKANATVYSVFNIEELLVELYHFAKQFTHRIVVMSVLYYFSLVRKNAVHECKLGLLAVKKWHIGRFDDQQKTLPKRRNTPVAPCRVE